MAKKFSTISQPKQGVVTDYNLIDTPKNSFTYCLNGALESKSADGNFTLVQNDASNILAVNFPEGFVVIGKRRVNEQNRVIYALVNPLTGDSQIGEVLDCTYNDNKDDESGFIAGCEDCIFPIERIKEPLESIHQQPYCSYHVIVHNACLGFNINYPVQIRYKITDCSLNIYFTDKLNERRFLYFDYNPDNTLRIQDRFKVISGFNAENCDQPIFENQIDCNKILYHPKYEVPCIDLVDVVEGGSLKAGVYQFFAAYSDVSGNTLTDYSPATQPIPIRTKSITFDTNYTTSKAIALKINNLDLSNIFSYYTLVVAETIDNFTEFKQVGVFPISQSLFLYTGLEITTKLQPSDVFFQRIYYKTAGNIANANDFLFFSDLEEFDIPNLQRAANNIKLYWQTAAIAEEVYSNPQNTFRFKSLDRDEVYPFGVVFEFDNGKEYGPYHIPGLSKDYLLNNYGLDVSTIVTGDDVLEDTSCRNIDRNQQWQVYNTAFVVGTPHEAVQDCDFNHVWEWGEFSYWESIRRYPNIPAVWGDLCGKPIRHHKAPDSRVTHIHDSLDGIKEFTDSNVVYPIGVLVDHSSVIKALDNAVLDGAISQEDRSRIVRYRIVRGNRVGNESIVAKGLLFDMWSYSKNNDTLYYANYPYNDLRRDNFIAPDDSTYSLGNTSGPKPSHFNPTGRYTFHSPDVHFKNPAIGTELKLETLEYGQSEGYFNHCEEQAKYKFLSTAATLLAFAAGVAAAFSAEKEKECKTVITRSMQQITGTVPGVIETLPAIPGVNYVPLSISDPFGALLYDDFTGQPIIPIDNPAVITEVQRNTCHGKTFQLLSPLSGNPAGLLGQQLIYLGIIATREMKIIEDLILSMVPEKNFAIQYNSVGKYLNYQNVNNAGFKIREIERSAYLDPMIQLINEAIDVNTSTFSNIYVNNWNRERSVYLKVDHNKPLFPSPAVEDTSRFTMDDFGLNQKDLDKKVHAPVSSYYGSIKRFVPDQYGEIASIEYLETGACYFDLRKDYPVNERGVFGGDKFITRFALKRKMPFFLQTRFRFPNEADVDYSELGNVGFPNYYFNTPQPIMERVANSSFTINSIFNGALFQDLLGVARSRLDARRNKLFYQSGFIHLYNYGIPYFLVESDVNTDYRHGENNVEKDYYPHQQDLGFWLQEKNVPITEDNYYFYNKTYSKQDKESFIGQETPDIDLRPCKVAHPSRVISSPQDQIDSKIDNWIVFRPNDYFDFPPANGRVIGLDGIEEEKVLVRFENTTKIFNAYDVLSTDFKEVQIGNEGLFKTRPREFASTSLGYGGSQHTDLQSTEFGHLWVDAKRGSIFNLGSAGSSLKDITVEEVRNWFKENLPFQIKKDFPEITEKDLDNNFKGIGLHLSFDKRFNRLFITKLDYKSLNKNTVYNTDTKEFYVGQDRVLPTNKKYFCNKSWTISYNLLTHRWIYHSFTPNFYVDNIEYFQSGLNGEISTLWSHNVTNKSYQVYYGKLYPFIVEIPSEAMIENGILNHVLYDSEAIRYHNQYDYVYDRTLTFNKAQIYNERQCTGEMDLIVRDENNLHDMVSYPKVFNNRQKILITNLNNQWFFNQFWDVVNTQKGNIPFYVNKCNNAEKVLNLDALNYYKSDFSKQPIRGKQTKIRLIQDAISTHKLILRFIENERTRDDF